MAQNALPRCEPPAHFRDKHGKHWLEGPPNYHGGPAVQEKFDWSPDRGWYYRGAKDGDGTPEAFANLGWRYICPVPTPDEIAAQAEREARLVAALREIADMATVHKFNTATREFRHDDGSRFRAVARAALAAYDGEQG